MTKRTSGLRAPTGTKMVGTATVREDRSIGGYAQRKLAEMYGGSAASAVDDIMACTEQVVSLAPRRVGVDVTPRAAAKEALQALGRMKAGTMNKTEARYAQVLELRKRAGEITWYRFEGMKFRLANKTFYTPDFAVMLSTGELELHEVKGFWQDDARVKIKVVAAQYPLQFIAVTAQSKRAGNGWNVEKF